MGAQSSDLQLKGSPGDQFLVQCFHSETGSSTPMYLKTFSKGEESLLCWLFLCTLAIHPKRQLTAYSVSSV